MDVPLDPSIGNYTFKTVSDLTGNTIVNVTVTAQNVSGVTVQGVPANYISSQNIWRAVLTGAVSVESSDIALTISTAMPISAIDTTKSGVIKGVFNDAYIRVLLLGTVAPADVTSVTLSDGTVLPYDSANGDYEKDVTYSGTMSTTVSVVLTTANGSKLSIWLFL